MIKALEEQKKSYQARIEELDTKLLELENIISLLEDEKEDLEDKIEVIDDMIADEVAKLKKNQ